MRDWHGAVILNRGVKKPDDITISLSDLAYQACRHYVHIPPGTVSRYKKLRAIEQRQGDTFSVALTFKGIADDFFNQIPGKIATYVGYALTELLRYIETLPPDQRAAFILKLEQDAYEHKRQQVAQLSQFSVPPQQGQQLQQAAQLSQFPLPPQQGQQLQQAAQYQNYPPQPQEAVQYQAYGPDYPPQSYIQPSAPLQANPRTQLRRRGSGGER